MNGQGGSTREEPGLDEEQEIVQVVPELSEDSATVSISCSDATGLGCDIARIIFNFGLTVYRGDFSTDGHWCFVMLHVRPSHGSPPCAKNWELLKSHLLRICSSERTIKKSKDAVAYTGNNMFLLQIQFQDQIGILHKIIHGLWESDLVVHKANISTSPDNKGLDVFYVSDKLDKLPKQSRINQIQKQITKSMNGLEAIINCHAFPVSKFSNKSKLRLFTGTRACKDSRARKLSRSLSNSNRDRRSSNASESLEMLPKAKLIEMERMDVHADNLVSSTHTVLHIECPDRKGLMYDLFRITKDIGLQISYAKIDIEDLNENRSICRTNLFVHDCELKGKLNDEMIEYICAEIKNSITTSIIVKVQNKTQDMGFADDTILQTEVLAVAPIDAGFRGRPRVLYDLTATLNSMGLSIFYAEMYTAEVSGDENDVSDKRFQEVHRFVIQGSNGKPILSREGIELMESELYSRLIGNNLHGESCNRQFSKSQAIHKFIMNGILD